MPQAPTQKIFTLEEYRAYDDGTNTRVMMLTWRE
jgi:hypothetical protein